MTGKIVDLNDVAEAAARIAHERERYTGAAYELCGPEHLRMNDIRYIPETRYHREIVEHYIPYEGGFHLLCQSSPRKRFWA